MSQDGAITTEKNLKMYQSGEKFKIDLKIRVLIYESQKTAHMINPSKVMSIHIMVKLLRNG